MDTIEIAAKMVRDAVTAMSGKLSTFVKAALDDKQDVATMPTKVSDFTNDSGFQDAQQVEDKIDAKISSAYKAGGSATMLTLPALTAAKLGVVVNMSEDFTTTSDFLEGAGKTYPAGTNVVVALAGENTYKYDVLAGFVDLSGYVQNTRKVGNVPLSADISVSLTGDTAITVTNTGTASAIGYGVSHANSGVTAGSKGDASAQTPAFGGTFKALSATVDAKGHVTALGDHNVTIPSDTATSQANGLMSSSDKAKLDALSVTASDPLEVTKTGETYNVALKDSGVTAGSKGDASAQTPAFGGAFKALSATVDAKGRLTALSEHTVTVPNAAATTAANGLMSSTDKAKLDGIASGATANVAATAAPLMDGTAAVGSSDKYARENHVHPTDTSRASAADVAAIKALLQNAVLYRTASGNPAAFSDGYAANLQKLAVTLTPTQSGSGAPSPTNVRPFTGVSSVTVTRTGTGGANSASVTVSLVDSNNNSLTVYGGTLDVTNGTLTVTHGFVECDGSENWAQSWGDCVYMNPAELPSSAKILNGNASIGGAGISDQYDWLPYDAPYDGKDSLWGARNNDAIPYAFSIYSNRVSVKDLRFANSADSFKARLAQSPLHIVYELATPLAYNLTPAQLAALPGYNSVSASAGTLSVEYRADTSLAYEELTNAILTLGGNVT